MAGPDFFAEMKQGHSNRRPFFCTRSVAGKNGSSGRVSRRVQSLASRHDIAREKYCLTPWPFIYTLLQPELTPCGRRLTEMRRPRIVTGRTRGRGRKRRRMKEGRRTVGRSAGRSVGRRAGFFLRNLKRRQRRQTQREVGRVVRRAESEISLRRQIRDLQRVRISSSHGTVREGGALIEEPKNISSP